MAMRAVRWTEAVGPMLGVAHRFRLPRFGGRNGGDPRRCSVGSAHAVARAGQGRLTESARDRLIRRNLPSCVAGGSRVLPLASSRSRSSG